MKLLVSFFGFFLLFVLVMSSLPQNNSCEDIRNEAFNVYQSIIETKLVEKLDTLKKKNNVSELSMWRSKSDVYFNFDQPTGDFVTTEERVLWYNLMAKVNAGSLKYNENSLVIEPSTLKHKYKNVVYRLNFDSGFYALSDTDCTNDLEYVMQLDSKFSVSVESTK